MSYPPPRPLPPLDTGLYSAAGQLTFRATDSTPPPPPPKSTTNQTNHDKPTSRSAPPYPPTPLTAPATYEQYGSANEEVVRVSPPSNNERWQPSMLTKYSKSDLESLLQSPDYLNALLHAQSTRHLSLPATTVLLQDLLSQNDALSRRLLSLSDGLAHQREEMTAQLLSLRGLERQWNLKQSSMDVALSQFAPKAIHARLVTGIQEQEALLVAIEESFLDEEGKAGEREIVDFLRRWKNGRRTLTLREERKERFEEGRVGGWR